MCLTSRYVSGLNSICQVSYLNLNLHLRTYLYSITTDKRVKYCHLRGTGILRSLSREKYP